MKIDLEMLEKIVSAGASGETVLAVVRHTIDQYEAKRSKRRPMEAKSKRKERGGMKVDTSGHEVDSGGHEVDIGGWPVDFADQFWREYPRKVEKLAAMRKLASVRKSGIVTFADLMAGVRRYASAVATTEPQYIKNPAAWLNAGRWSDDAAALKRVPQKSGAQGFESLLNGNHGDDTAARSEYDIDLAADSAH